MEDRQRDLRNPIIEPGTYKCGMPGIHGGLLYLYRCPHCWFDWLGIPHQQPQTAYGQAATLVYPQCGQSGDYVCADNDAYAEKKISAEVSVIRRRILKADTSVPGSLFDGIPDDTSSGTGIGEGSRERDNLRR